METTIGRLLQQAVTAHKGGNVQEAKDFYQAILQSQPFHADANHNLGLIAVYFNNIEAALPLFEIAVDANPKVEQFWLSYIDALINENLFDRAKKVWVRGSGFVTSDRYDALKEKLYGNNFSPPASQVNILLKHYQAGQYDDAEKLAISLTQQFPEHQFGWKILGVLCGRAGRISDALRANQKAAETMPQDPEAHNNLGIALKALGRLEDSEASYRQAIALKPDYAEAYYNLANSLKEMRRYEEVVENYKQAIALQPDYAHAHVNLGVTLKDMGRVEEAVLSYRRAIAIKPDYAEPHSNLGIALLEMGRVEDAQESCRQAIELKLDCPEAHNSLGDALYASGRSQEAKASYRQAIALKADFALPHFNLGKALYSMGHESLALDALEESYDIDPHSKDTKLLLSVIKSRQSREESGVSFAIERNNSTSKGLPSNPTILNRAVEAGLIDNLYGMGSRQLDNTRDARFGSGTCSLDFALFEDTHPLIKTLAKDLTSIMMAAVASDVFVFDSFFNILGPGGGSTPHMHLNGLDRHTGFNLREQKYSLVYYLSVGDQNCSEPGVLKLYDPVEDILPYNGMITIIPASRKHSAVYGGKTDRVMIGANFYSL
ncbi:tetratricopeptide repeat protein [Porticoccaceae bacterium]|nr:tetratricopeptide repeat protein [Porticoccaceae bacterium]